MWASLRYCYLSLAAFFAKLLQQRALFLIHYKFMSLISFLCTSSTFLIISIFEAFPKFSMNVYNSTSSPVQNKSWVFLTKALLHSFAPGFKKRESRCKILRESRSTLQADLYSFLSKCYILFLTICTNFWNIHYFNEWLVPDSWFSMSDFLFVQEMYPSLNSLIYCEWMWFFILIK